MAKPCKVAEVNGVRLENVSVPPGKPVPTFPAASLTVPDDVTKRRKPGAAAVVSIAKSTDRDVTGVLKFSVSALVAVNSNKAWPTIRTFSSTVEIEKAFALALSVKEVRKVAGPELGAMLSRGVVWPAVKTGDSKV